MQAAATAIPFNIERVRIVFSLRYNVGIPMAFIINQDKNLLKNHSNRFMPFDPPGRRHPNH